MGGIPEWYRAQLRDDIVASAANALRQLREATITTGTVSARQFNRERRSTYWSAPDYEPARLHARTTEGGHGIATLVNYGGHPTVLDDQPLLHGDWPAAAAAAWVASSAASACSSKAASATSRRADRTTRPSISRATRRSTATTHVIQHGDDFATFVHADIARGGHPLPNSKVKAMTRGVVHPITNIAENGLAFAGLLDRDFVPVDRAPP